MGGPPLRPGSACAPWAGAVRSPPPPARTHFARAAGAEGGLPCLGPCHTVGSCGGVIGGSPRVPAARRGRALLGGGYHFYSPPSAATRVRRGRPFGGATRLRPSSLGLLRSENSLGSALWILFPPSRGDLALLCSGVPPRSLAARHGRALLGGSSPSPSPPSAAARVRPVRLFGGGPLLRLSLVRFPLQAHPLGFSVPPLLILVSRAVLCGPMAVLPCCRPRTGFASHRRLRHFQLYRQLCQ